MQIEADKSSYDAAVTECEERIAKLNKDGSFDGFAVLFARLSAELPSDFFKLQLMAASDANNVCPVLAVLSPGPRLEAITSALRAFDFDAHDRPPVSA